MRRPQVIFTLGLPASGKSTFVEKYLKSNFIIIDSDNFTGSYEQRNQKVIDLGVDLGENLYDLCIMGSSGGSNFKESLMWFKKLKYKITIFYFNMAQEKSESLNNSRSRTVPKEAYDSCTNNLNNNINIAKEHADYFYEISPFVR